MLGLADIESWSDDVRDEIVADLRRRDWQAASVAADGRPRLRRLMACFLADRPLSLGELSELRNGLGRP